MKKSIYLVVTSLIFITAALAQDLNEQKLQVAVSTFEKASTVNDYQLLANDFASIGDGQRSKWLPYYYAALCNAKIGWLYQYDGEKIEPFTRKADAQIKKAFSLLDTAVQKKELSEVYCVLSMVNRANVFINPMTYGRQYGPAASRYTQLAKNVNPGNPRAIYLEGWEKYSAPKMWGGDKKKAKELLEVAAKQLEVEKVQGNYPRWGKTEVTDLLNKL